MTKEEEAQQLLSKLDAAIASLTAQIAQSQNSSPVIEISKDANVKGLTLNNISTVNIPSLLKVEGSLSDADISNISMYIEKDNWIPLLGELTELRAIVASGNTPNPLAAKRSQGLVEKFAKIAPIASLGLALIRFFLPS